MHHAWSGDLKIGENPLSDIAGDTFDLRTEIAVGSAKEIKLSLRGVEVVYNPAKRELRMLGKAAPLVPIEGRIKLQILLDRSSLEVFANDGAATMASCYVPPKHGVEPALKIEGVGANVKSLDVWELKSCWPD